MTFTGFEERRNQMKKILEDNRTRIEDALDIRLENLKEIGGKAVHHANTTLLEYGQGSFIADSENTETVGYRIGVQISFAQNENPGIEMVHASAIHEITETVKSTLGYSPKVEMVQSGGTSDGPNSAPTSGWALQFSVSIK